MWTQDVTDIVFSDPAGAFYFEPVGVQQRPGVARPGRAARRLGPVRRGTVDQGRERRPVEARTAPGSSACRGPVWRSRTGSPKPGEGRLPTLGAGGVEIGRGQGDQVADCDDPRPGVIDPDIAGGRRIAGEVHGQPPAPDDADLRAVDGHFGTQRVGRLDGGEVGPQVIERRRRQALVVEVFRPPPRWRQESGDRSLYGPAGVDPGPWEARLRAGLPLTWSRCQWLLTMAVIVTWRSAAKSRIARRCQAWRPVSMMISPAAPARYRIAVRLTVGDDQSLDQPDAGRDALDLRRRGRGGLGRGRGRRRAAPRPAKAATMFAA